MINPLFGFEFLIDGIAFILIGLIDYIVYSLVSFSYTVFLVVSRINLFATGSGKELFETITTQVYTILGVVMIFIFAYQLILLVINPDGGAKTPSKLFWDSVVSLLLVIVAPTLYSYLALFQDHVLTNNTIPAIILGTNATTDVGEGAGTKMAMMVLVSFYRPNGSTYTTFYDLDGELRDKSEAVSECSTVSDGSSEGANPDSNLCSLYYDALADFESRLDIAAITWPAEIRNAISGDDGMHYSWLISTICGLVVAWFFLSYTIDIGTRAVKLGFLQLISPVPLIFRAFPQTRKTFETWFGEMKRTYLEIFIRLAVIFFVVRLCQLVPTFINLLFETAGNIGGNILVRALATVALILGLLKFAKDAPNLIKTMFDTGGNLLAGLNLKPGVKSRVEDTPYLKNMVSGATGFLGGAVAGGVNAYKMHQQNHPNTGDNLFSPVFGALHGAYGAARGALVGGRHGLQNPQDRVLSTEALRDSFVANTQHARSSYERGNALERLSRAGSENAAGQGLGSGGARAYVEGMWDHVREGSREVAEHLGEGGTQIRDVITGEGSTIAARHQAVSDIQQYLNMMQNLSKSQTDQIKSIKNEFMTDVLKDDGSGVNAQMSFSKKDLYNSKGEFELSKRLSEYMSREGIALNDGAAGSALIQQLMNTKDGETVAKSVKVTRNDYDSAIYKGIMQDYDDLIHKEMAKALSKPSNVEAARKMAATVNKELAKNSSALGADTIAALNEAVKGMNMGYESAGDFLTELSKMKLGSDGKPAGITADEAAMLAKINSTLSAQDRGAALQMPKPDTKPKNGGGSDTGGGKK